ncbi:helix-turn-helix transcriptional regulator [Sciscionella sediminilitoris]|uniref:helix-turn-helix transcriptional regulator n=1 Tax=Sciscionella sediminilitoris TaxID=1445613 RepID=UPI0004DF3776|nr:helix-turn-helix transcriptional regulator [Sciscionella sp. SE31]
MTGSDFGRAVRGWRERVSPETVGLPLGGKRRAAGLRREELAMLAGISVDYVIRLEQGRSRHPSVPIVEALARALRVHPNEREHLFRLAGLVPPGQGTVPAYLTPSVQRMLDRLTGTPVAVYDAALNLLVANPMYTALFGELRGRDRNAVWRNLLGSGTRVRHTPEARHAFEAGLVGDLRRTASRYPDDQRLQRLIADLHAHSPRFTELWDAGTVARQEVSRKIVDHPEVGPVTLDCDLLSVAGSDLRVMVYTAEPDTEDAQRLALLSVLGTQPMGAAEVSDPASEARASR